MNLFPERRVNSSALMHQAMNTIDELRAENAKLKLQADSGLRVISKLEADLVTARFVAQSHGHAVDQLTRIRGELIVGLQEIKKATSNLDTSSWLVRQVVRDLADAGLRLAGAA